MYKYRQVKCPRCKHIFMWLDAPMGASYCLYRRRGSEEELYSTTCPKCNLEMIVPGNVIEGIDINCEAVELFSTVRGI
jgi:endogenous inhibitor of DNA gyrase (YacG/DUF329 family)